ncbi:MAG: nitroreductase family protein [bacterium]
MIFSRPAPDVIRERSSWRAYEDRPIAPESRERLEAAVRNGPATPFGSSVRIELADVEPPNFLELRKYGTYGIIKGARCYLIGAVTRAEFAMEDFGYSFERAILHATDLGLRTCWVGGTLNRSSFAERIGAQPDEVVPAISPVGIGTERRALRDVLIRLGAGSHKRQPWEALFFHTFGSPLTAREAGPYQTPLEMVRLAPSASNRQPWRVLRDPNRPVFHFFLQRSRFYHNKLTRIPDVDLQRIDIGIGICHFELAAREAGLEGAWERRPPDVSPLPSLTQYVVSWVGA